MTLNVKSKIWVESEGLPLLGEGRRDLLEKIKETGSISEAARQVGVSYKKAWSYIKNMEDRLGVELVKKQVGGKGGGGATLTDMGRKLIEKFDQLMAGSQEDVDERFKEIFKPAPRTK